MTTRFRVLFLRAGAVTLAMLLSPLAIAQAQTGTVEGRVFNAATGAALAHVMVDGTNREAMTDEEPRLAFFGVRKRAGLQNDGRQGRFLRHDARNAKRPSRG